MGQPAADTRGHAARIRILREAFVDISDDQAACLVGILFEFRFVLSIETWNPTTQVKLHKLVNLAPLEPQVAAVLVGDTFQLDCDDVYQRFMARWSEIRHSPMTASLSRQIRFHPTVARLERTGDL